MVTTIEIIRAGWPLVLGFVATILYAARVDFMARQTEKDFQEWKTKTYPADKNAILEAIQSVRADLERSEDKIESQLEKVHTEVSEINKSLARIEGRLYSNHIKDH